MCVCACLCTDIRWLLSVFYPPTTSYGHVCTHQTKGSFRSPSCGVVGALYEEVSHLKQCVFTGRFPYMFQIITYFSKIVSAFSKTTCFIAKKKYINTSRDKSSLLFKILCPWALICLCHQNAKFCCHCVQISQMTMDSVLTPNSVKNEGIRARNRRYNWQRA